MKVIGFSIFKGGTGKSTSDVHTAYTCHRPVCLIAMPAGAADFVG
jgi:cellulose biosynthesis protein BcsQ